MGGRGGGFPAAGILRYTSQSPFLWRTPYRGTMPVIVKPGEAFQEAPGEEAPLAAWERRCLENMPHHKEVVIPRFSEAHLLAKGYRRSVGEPHGQKEDYRRRLEDDRGLHVKDYGDRMTIHWDKVDPSASRIRHLLHDAPELTAGSILLGAMGVAAVRSLLGWR